MLTIRAKTVIITVTATVLLAAIIVLSRERSPFGRNNSNFSSVPEKSITRIELSDDHSRIVLERKEDVWILNGNRETRSNSVLFLLKILSDISIKSTVSEELFNREINELGIRPVRVKVYEGRRILQSFLVYKTSSNSYGNVMKLREGSKPFICYVPGFDSDIGSAFTLKEAFWQPFTLFSHLPSEIASVTVTYINDPGSSFMIRNEEGSLSLYDPVNKLAGWDTSRIMRYLSYFANVSFESWASELSEREKTNIADSVPAYRISLESVKGNNVALTLWVRKKVENGVEKTDSDRLWGRTEASDEFVIVRYMDIDPLLKKRSYFYPV
ncbi:MAG: hypothetical protein RBR81_05740 [Bacteroidales bacterium]|jgi:hypothetical protein|nr:hypothetical protein [Bacteroidales bacterium]